MRSSVAVLGLLSVFCVVPLSARAAGYTPPATPPAQVAQSAGSAAFSSSAAPPSAAERLGRIAYGPFRVIDGERVALIGLTDSHTPDQFARLLRDYPRMRVVVMVDCPGTDDDIANFRLGRMIRAHNMATVVPTGGSVRSGGVELFIAGARRYADRGAEFAVHSWMDGNGREAADFSATAPENHRYVDYYSQMGMTSQEAQSFYAMTNSVPYASARWLGTNEMGDWLALNRVVKPIPSVRELRAMVAQRISSRLP